jgi:hypothetical protein
MREAAILAYGVNLLMIVAAVVSIVLLVPKGRAGGHSPSTPAAAQGAKPAAEATR